MAHTLNYTVQRVLDKLNLDPVNSINDTEDSLLVAREAESTFYDIISRHDWTFQEQAIKLEAAEVLTDENDVVVQIASLKLPEDVIKINTLYALHPPYPTDINSDGDGLDWKEVKYLTPKEFIENSFKYKYDPTSTKTAYVYYKDKDFHFNIGREDAPRYFTTFDDENIVFDSVDKNVGMTVLPLYTMCLGFVEPSWTTEDDFVIPVPSKLYPMFLSALTVACSQMLLSTRAYEEERRYNRAMNRMSHEAYRVAVDRFPKVNFGRKGNGLA